MSVLVHSILSAVRGVEGLWVDSAKKLRVAVGNSQREDGAEVLPAASNDQPLNNSSITDLDLFEVSIFQDSSSSAGIWASWQEPHIFRLLHWYHRALADQKSIIYTSTNCIFSEMGLYKREDC